MSRSDQVVMSLLAGAYFALLAIGPIEAGATEALRDDFGSISPVPLAVSGGGAVFATASVVTWLLLSQRRRRTSRGGPPPDGSSGVGG